MNKRPKLIFGSSRATRFARYVLAMFAYILLAASVVHAQDPKDNPQKSGVVATDLIVRAVEGVANQEFTVIDVKYAPGGVNRRHFHPAAVTFFIVSGTPVFQEEGKEPITLKPGDSLLVPAGTTHSHWNPSKAEGVRWLEFIVAEKGKGRSIRKP